MKNYSLIKLGGFLPFALLDLNAEDNGEQYIFKKYVSWLKHTKGYSNNTIKQYAGHVARFLDFVCELNKIESNETEISHLIYLYQEYLTHGENSENPTVCELVERLGKDNQTSITSISQGIEAALSGFFTLILSLSDNDPLLKQGSIPYFTCNIRTKSLSERKQINKNDWLASTIKGSISRGVVSKGGIKVFHISKRYSQNSSKTLPEGKDFPFEKTVELISLDPNKKLSASYVRDMTIYAFLAASGCRIFECLQLTIDDIDFESNSVFIRNPFVRKLKGLSPGESDSLMWKGRETEKTFLIEPFATIFWNNLHIYIERFFMTNTNHHFIFQKHNGSRRPFFASDRSTFEKNFKQRSESIGVKKYSPHSLRHSYAIYTLNYLPTNDGYGLPIAYVKILMGHASLSSTEIYAIHDTEIIDYVITLSNQYTQGNKISLAEVKENYIDSQIKLLENQKERLNV